MDRHDEPDRTRKRASDVGALGNKAPEDKNGDGTYCDFGP